MNSPPSTEPLQHDGYNPTLQKLLQNSALKISCPFHSDSFYFFTYNNEMFN
jgi:hypothetical protein